MKGQRRQSRKKDRQDSERRALRQKSVVKKPKGKLKKEGKSKNKGEGERKGGDTNTWEPKVKEIRGFCVSSN
ncbi:hypothetical protein V6N13_066450 [Hibiscus sabdariffa]